MKNSVKLSRVVAPLCSALLLCSTAGVSAFAATSHVAPALERFGQNLGQESPSTELNLTVWLNLHNKSDLDARVQEIYTKGSPSFGKFLSNADLQKYAPSAAELAAVKAELASHGLRVTGGDTLGMSVHVTGSTSNFERAFSTTINRVSFKGEVVRTTSSLPVLGGKAEGLVSHVAGLNSMPMKPTLVRPIDPRTHKPLVGRKIASNAKPDGTYFLGQCFYNSTTLSLSGISADDFVTPETASYTGTVYGGDPTSTAKGDLAPCGYSPSDVSKIYGLKKAYDAGYDGKGQTIVIVDPYLEPTAQANLDLFSSIEGLPPVTITEISAPFGTTGLGIAYGWDGETDLDVQWAHAVAPGAAITLLDPFSAGDEDLQNAVFYAVSNHLGNVVSNSYSEPESFESPFSSSIWDEINEIAAASGVSVHFATGDDGDDTDMGIPADVPSPADSPYATAVGGTSVAITPDNQIFTTGWGTNIDFLSFQEFNSDGSTTTYVEDPTFGFFYAGSGGGTSVTFAKPYYQAALSGPGRHLPDVSALADPYTGGEYVYDDGQGDQFISTTGGTSLATPIFSGIWALVDQAVGGTVGQAAPLVSIAPADWIVDVVPTTGPANVTGSNTSAGGTTTYSAATLAEPLESTTVFADGIWDLGEGEYAIVTFGTDSGLTVTQGWDNVTGFGTPNIGNIVGDIKALYKK